jgi:two-component system, NtrC family, sensor histidine kinase HydH
MLKTRLIWRMVGPVLVLSMLLVFIGAVAGWYIHATNAAVSESLHRCLAAVIEVEELVLAIRDARIEVNHYGTSEDDSHLARAHATRERIVTALRRIDTEMGATAGKLSQQIAEAQQRFFGGLASSGGSARDDADRWWKQITEELLDPSLQLLQQCQQLAEDDSLRNRAMANWVGMGLFVLGVCGAAAGLLAGHGIARAVSRSLEELGGSVRKIAGTLDEPLEDSREMPAVPDLPDLYSTMQRLAGKTATVVQELHETRQHAELSGHFAAIGQFATGLAHELRNPLTSIKLLVQSAEERQAGLAGRDLEVLEEEIERLENLLQSFIDYARPPSLHPQTLDADALIRQAVDFAQRRAEQHGVRIRCQSSSGAVWMRADPQKLRQLLLNLLLNAIDAQPDGGEVTVRLQAVDPPQAGLTVIEVADRGPGLPPELGAQIFEPFVSTKEMGLGLGLSVCRRIAESHGGSLQAENRSGGGAVFRLALPRRMD